jgi:hypothetical protein
MTRTSRIAIALTALLCAVSVRAGDARLDLTIDTPEAGSIIGDPGGTSFVAGKALALFGKFQAFDIAFVIDTSESTSAPSGADVDGDGEVGHRRGADWLTVFGKVLPLPNSDRGDNVLAAEVAAVRTLIDQLDPRTTRVGLVAFSGDLDPMVTDSYTAVPLTSDFQKVYRGLDDILDRGPGGMTNMASGVNLATAELLGTDTALSERREDAQRIMLFLTDGIPTLPYDGSRAQNAREAIAKAMRAARFGVRIDTYAIGEEALAEPVVAIEMARVSNGIFTPVRDPKNLRAIFEQVSFAEIEKLEIVNKTTRTPASYHVQNADGSFAALVPMREGSNVIEVHARATDGSEARKSVAVRFLGNGSPAALSPRQIAQRNRLLENRLSDLQRKRAEIELERDEGIRSDLRVEIEREREEAKARADEAKKRLRIEVEE